MTRDELLAKIDKHDHAIVIGGIGSEIEVLRLMEFRKALRAVVELHKPVMDDCCEACYREEYFGGRHLEVGKYPCETIQAIEKELS